MEVKTVFISITGKIQNVGFRYFAKNKANELEIFGWVMNTRDGRVEIEAEGKSDNLKIFTDWLRIGPPRSLVKSLTIAEIQRRNFSAFIIC